MTESHQLDAAPATLHHAENAALQRLLNSFLRETGAVDPRTGPGPNFSVTLSASEIELTGELTHWSPLGHHVYSGGFRVTGPRTSAAAAGLREVTDLLLTELAASADAEAQDRNVQKNSARSTALAAQVQNSVQRTARYLEQVRPTRPGADRPRDLTRYAEQSLLLGHPMHPTPKSSEGFADEELDAYAPELGAAFQLTYFAVAPALVREERIAPGEWLPPQVREQILDTLPHRYFEILPIHPWQADYLMGLPQIRKLVDAGALVRHDALGPAVYPTSSVRTVCAPDYTTAWKLPLHVRITNFIRDNPAEHTRRAVDASRVVDACRQRWYHPGFHTLIETGFRSLADPELQADTAVLFRENPFVDAPEAPQVVASLLEERPDHGRPDLVGYVRQACGVPEGPLPQRAAGVWLERYLEISLIPLLQIFESTGISFEAHVQNSLLHLDEGWPSRFYVRDMEGVSVSRERARATSTDRWIEEGSALLYDHEEAWHRLQYYAITNHLGHLIHVLARSTGVQELYLWEVVALALRSSAATESASRLTSSPFLPAKANLTSRFAGRSERPSYVLLPNPMFEVHP